MKADIKLIKKIRLETGAGYSLCKKVLVESSSIEEAHLKLRQAGFDIAKDKLTQQTSHGVIHSYLHTGNRLAAMVEVKCESDFVAKTTEINELTQNLAMQVAAMKPQYISRDDIPKEKVGMEQWRRKERLEKEGDDASEDVMREEMNRWYSEICLLEQPYVKDGAKQVKDLISEIVLRVKENCRVSRFQLWEVGVDSMATFGEQHKRQYEELKENTSQLEHWCRVTTDSLVGADEKGNIIFWNNGAEAMFGYTAAEAKGQPLTMLMPSKHVSDHHAGFSRFVSRGGDSFNGQPKEFDGIRKNGEEFPLELTVCAWKIGGQYQFGAIIRDISPRHKIEKNLLEYQKFIEAVFESMSSHFSTYKVLKEYYGGYLERGKK